MNRGGRPATKRGLAEWRALVDGMSIVDPACLNDPRFTYDDLGASDLAVMSEICAACPLVRQCQDFARVAKPSGGYWAGRNHTKGNDW